MASKRGFTLIELAIVVVVIGLLAALALPKFSVTAHRSKEKEADILLKQVLLMHETYLASRGVAAQTVGDLMEVGFVPPQDAGLKFYTWTDEQPVTLPLCLATNPPGAPWQGRQIDANGAITPC